MELLDRYLQAVQFWLPKKQKQDIIAELSEDLRSQIEEKENELGRKLTEPELEAILKRCGSPLTVASHYWPKEYLIGPTMFRVYRFVMGIMLLGVIVPRTLVWIGFLLLDPEDRGVLNMGNMFETIVFCAFFTTLAFAIFERTGIKVQILDQWNPRKLPPVKDPNRIPLFSSSFEIGGAIVFGAWFFHVLWPHSVMEVFGVKIMLAPAWQGFFWAFVILTMCNLAMSGVSLFRPYWTPARAFLRLFLDVVGGTTFCWLLKAQLLLGISAPGISESRADAITDAINSIMAKALPWAVVVLIAIFLADSYRLLRVWNVDRRRGTIAPAVNGVINSIAAGN